MITVARQPSPQPPNPSDRPPERMRLLIVDDHSAVRAGLQQLLDDQADFDVVAAVAAAEAVSVAEAEPVDVAVVDYQLGARNGLWVSPLDRPPRRDGGRGLSPDSAVGAGIRATLIGGALETRNRIGSTGCEVRPEVPLEDGA